MKSVELLILNLGILLLLSLGNCSLRVKRGNYGNRNHGGLGGGQSGAGPGGVTGQGAHGHSSKGVYQVYDSIAQHALSGPTQTFANQYQASRNAGAGSAAGLYHQQQQGQRALAYAIAASNDASGNYNRIATGRVYPGYKGEHRK